jgi:hypothetical protein
MLVVGGRGGQKPVKTDPPDKTARPVRPAARPLVVHGRILDFVIFLIRVSGGPRVLCFFSGGYPPARPLVFKEKKKTLIYLTHPQIHTSHLISLSFHFPSPHFILPLPASQTSTPQHLPSRNAVTPSTPQHRHQRHTSTP